MGAAGAHRQQDARPKAASRQAAKERQSPRTRLRLQHQGAAGPGAATGSAGGTQLRTLRRTLEDAAAEGRGARAPQSGKERIGRLAALAADTPRFATRSLARNQLACRRRFRLSISSVVSVAQYVRFR